MTKHLKSQITKENGFLYSTLLIKRRHLRTTKAMQRKKWKKPKASKKPSSCPFHETGKKMLTFFLKKKYASYL